MVLRLLLLCHHFHIHTVWLGLAIVTSTPLNRFLPVRAHLEAANLFGTHTDVGSTISLPIASL